MSAADHSQQTSRSMKKGGDNYTRDLRRYEMLAYESDGGNKDVISVRRHAFPLGIQLSHFQHLAHARIPNVSQ